MHQTNRILACAIIILISVSSFAQQTPKTLLWRISGKGLSKPSYLFGTMHLTDKRLFNFTDSVYHGIESTEGFAVEIDFREYMDSIFKSGLIQAENELFEKQVVNLDKKILGTEADSLLKQFGIEGNSINKKQLKKIRDYRMGKIVQKGEMETIVDGFLYGIAMKNGKWLGAVEDVSDQLNLSDEIGGELSPDQVFISEKEMKKGIEAMIGIYVKEDLDALGRMVDNYSGDYKTAVLTNRNYKMARRIDSLTAIRSMFIAVGAAHLPGEAGLISLLRKNGFRVEPVLSNNRIAGPVYSKKLAAAPWHQVKGGDLPYVVDMPGIPTDHNLFGENVKMKMVFDLTTMSFYMSGFASGAMGSSQDLDRAFANMSKELSGREIKPKKIEGTNFEGREGVINTDEASYKVQIISAYKNIYFLFAGSNRAAVIQSEDFKKYFASFRPVEIKYEKKADKVFTIPGKAFSVVLPGEPQRNSTIDRQAEGTSMKISTYDLTDNATEKYYMIMVKELGEGNYLENDSVYFDEYITTTEAKFDVVRKEISTYKGFPCLYFDGLYQEAILYKTFQVIRGGRIYFLMMGGKKDEMGDSDAFFNSFKMEEYPDQASSKQTANGFYSSAPAVIKDVTEKEAEKEDGAAGEDNNNVKTYISHDEQAAISYSVVTSQLSPYYWVKDQEAWFKDRQEAYVEEGDSLIERKVVMNGKLPGIEFTIKKPHSHNILKVRTIVSGNELYTVLGYIPQPYLNKAAYQKFFEDFRLDNEVPPSIYTNKTQVMMDSLLSKDSLVYRRAAEALSNTDFEKEDLPVLHAALLQEYTDTSYYIEVRDELAEKIININDSSTVDFINRQYSLPKNINSNLQYPFLGILANIHNEYSYKTLQSLLDKGMPKGNEKWLFERGMSDSLELTKMLVPQLLKYTSDSLFNDAVYNVFNLLVQKEMISMDVINSQKKDFLSHAGKVLTALKKDNEGWYRFYDWVSFIGLWNDKESNDLLKGFLQIPQLGLKRLAIKELLLNQQTVPATEFLQLAKDTLMRGLLYQDLVDINRTELMPALYATQKSISESILYDFASDENEVSAIHFAGEQVVTHEGKKVKYLLYRIVFPTDDGNISYLGVAGPYELVSKKAVTGAIHTGIYWDEPYDKAKMVSQFNKFREGL